MKAITFQQYFRIASQLPSDPTMVDYTKQGMGAIPGNRLTVVLDGIQFDWIEEDKMWECKHPIRISGFSGIFKIHCIDCKESTEHVVNKDTTKVKCKKCGKITTLKL